MELLSWIIALSEHLQTDTIGEATGTDMWKMANHEKTLQKEPKNGGSKEGSMENWESSFNRLCFSDGEFWELWLAGMFFLSPLGNVFSDLVNDPTVDLCNAFIISQQLKLRIGNGELATGSRTLFGSDAIFGTEGWTWGKDSPWSKLLIFGLEFSVLRSRSEEFSERNLALLTGDFLSHAIFLGINLGGSDGFYYSLVVISEAGTDSVSECFKVESSYVGTNCTTILELASCVQISLRYQIWQALQPELLGALGLAACYGTP